jgi:putative colanic acid biosynthesis glycosyltransferase WcaI
MVSASSVAVPKGWSPRRWRADAAAARAERITRAMAPPRDQPARILFLNQYYWPDHASTAQHLTDLAESLAGQGHECHVVCSRGGYKPGTTKRVPREQTHNDVRIHRVAATSLGRKSSFRRMADYLSFYSRAVMRCLALGRFDVVVTLTTPPIIGLLGTILRAIHGTRHVVWSMDLHPDASIALGRMSTKNPIVTLLAKLSDHVVKRADRVVALGPYMADRLLAKGVRSSRLVEIPVWSRADEISSLPRSPHPLRQKYGLDDKIVLMYSGNLGLAHATEEFIGAARKLVHRPEIVFLFVGGGPRIVEIKAAKQRLNLSNIRLLDYFPRAQLRESLSIADVHLVSMRAEMTGIVVPGKLYGAMASGRPVFFVGPDHCETADTIRDHDCGQTIRQGDISGLVDAIEAFVANPKAAREQASRGRIAFLEHFERETCCRLWSSLVRELTGEMAINVELQPSNR